MLTVWVIVAVYAQLENYCEISTGHPGRSFWERREAMLSDEETHSFQPWSEVAPSILIPISVLVIRKRIERIITLVILGRISPAGINI